MAMKLDQALQEHTQLASRIEDGLRSHSHDGSAQMPSECSCNFGKWLYANGTRFIGAAGYVNVVAAHSEFHRDATLLTATARVQPQSDAELCRRLQQSLARFSTAVATFNDVLEPAAA